MALSFVGYHGSTGTSVATTNNVGDLLLVRAYRSGSTTAPTRPGTYSAVDTGTQSSSGGAGSTNVATACGWRIATASNEGSGTWTNATAVEVLVFRGTATSPIGNVAKLGASATATLIRYPSLTRTESTSWYAMFGGRLSAGANASVATAPNDGTTAMTNRGSVPATPYAAAHAALSAGNWTQTDVSIGGTGYKYVSWVIEILEAPSLISGTVEAGSEGGATAAADVYWVAQDRLTEDSQERVTEDNQPRWTEGIAPPTTGTVAAGSESGATASGTIRVAGTAASGSESGVTANGLLINAGPATAGSASGATAAAAVRVNATGGAGSESGVSADGSLRVTATGSAASESFAFASGIVIPVSVTITGDGAAGSESGATGTAAVRLTAIGSAGSESWASGTARVAVVATAVAGSESGATGTAIHILTGTGAAGSESGAAGIGAAGIPASGGACSESGADASATLRLVGTGRAGSESGALGAGDIIYPPVTGTGEAGSEGGAYAVGRLVVVLLPGTVGRHTVAPFHSPVQGAPVNPDIVRGNDTILQRAFNSHDEDPTIHVQSSPIARRPAAGVAGRLWVTENAGVYELWFDDGSTWQPVT